MKLRSRLALTFAVFTSLTIALAFVSTLAVFRNAQQRGLDQALWARAELEAAEVVSLGGNTLDIKQAPEGTPISDLEQLVKYGVLYDGAGRPVAQTTTFGDRAPPLSELIHTSTETLPQTAFDFRFSHQQLRGVLFAVAPTPQGRGALLLLAAPRDDLDADTVYLFRVMAFMFLAMVALSVLFGRLFGAHVTRGIDAVADVARRVAQGALDARANPATVGPDHELQRLATDLNEMIDRLGSLLTAERRFVSSAAHELRSPLSALRGELELALRHPRSAEQYQAAINEALESTDRLITLSEDLLSLARAGTSERRAEERVSVAEMVEAAVRATRRSEQRKIEVTLDAELFTRGRSLELVRMIRNLLDNAVVHAPAESAVRVSGRLVADQIELAVEDDGRGVDEALRDRIFDPFFRGEDNPDETGTGLGLAIAREIARIHGGEIKYDAASRSTRFVAVLPRA